MTNEEEKSIWLVKGLQDDKDHLIIEQRQAITTILNLIDKLQEENTKLKKQIDLMAEDLKTDYHSKEWVIKNYEEKVK